MVIPDCQSSNSIHVNPVLAISDCQSTIHSILPGTHFGRSTLMHPQLKWTSEENHTNVRERTYSRFCQRKYKRALQMSEVILFSETRFRSHVFKNKEGYQLQACKNGGRQIPQVQNIGMDIRRKPHQCQRAHLL